MSPPNAPSRRTVLCGLGVALAGCTGSQSGSTSQPTSDPPETSTTPSETPSDTPSESPTDTPTATTLAPGETFDAGERTVTVSAPTVRASIVTLDHGSSVHPDVYAIEGEQFVAVEIVAEGGSPPEPESLDVALDGELAGARAYRYGTDRTGKTRRRLAFRVPVTDVETAAVVWKREEGDVAWRLPERERIALGKRPVFEVTEFSVPDSVEAGAAIDVTLKVANVGGRDGRFLAELGAVVASDVGEVSFDVPAGGGVTKEFSLTPGTYTPMFGDSGEPLRVVLDWGTLKMEREVAVESETATGTATETGTPDG